MKKLLLVLFIIPAFIYGQDVPLTEKKVTTESMENKERKLKEKADDKVRKENTKRTNKYNRSLKMSPKKQIAWVFNPTSAPYGVNYFSFWNNRFGWYLDVKSNLSAERDLPTSNTGDIYDDADFIVDLYSAYPTGYVYEGTEGFDVVNLGIATSIVHYKNSVLILYFGFGVGTATQYSYAEYDWDSYLYSSGAHVRSHTQRNVGNMNIGVLRQGKWLSIQFGFDTSMPGPHLGIGINWG